MLLQELHVACCGSGAADRARLLLARYSQRWVKAVSRGALAIAGAEGGAATPTSHHVAPRHALTRQCPCQYIEDHLHYKPQGCFALCDVWQQGGSTVTIVAPPAIGQHINYVQELTGLLGQLVAGIMRREFGVEDCLEHKATGVKTKDSVRNDANSGV
ncbi:hypothetical protein E2C01_031313 [Portunus trituberculatus]|uniref:Uncharacterized protein n=1 Tax=Portunus trituberculatus TaxID=210409 RepID=A0A5B7EXS5_PORTR|nr:hypothetical protein [Portunus trituberculatus]